MGVYGGGGDINADGCEISAVANDFFPLPYDQTGG